MLNRILDLFQQSKESKNIDREFEKQKLVYEQAGQWLRMANILTWTIGALFIPLSLYCFVLAINDKNDDHDWLYCAGSLALHFVWTYMALSHGFAAWKSREALMKIEEKWEIHEKLRFYHRQRFIFTASVILLVIFTAMLIIGWVLLFDKT
ncbi:MAG: hypothetical protein GY861_01685 [bacterium]|nr:hypothetical protein [bacterium]